MSGITGASDVHAAVDDADGRMSQVESLRASEAYLREAQRMTKTGSFAWPRGDFEPIFSDELRRIFGFAADEPITLGSVLERVHPDDIELVLSKVQAGRDGEEFDYVCRLQRPDGQIRYLRNVAHGYRVQNGRQELIVSVQDITDTKTIEEALRTQAEELRRAHAHLTAAQRLSKTGSFEWDVWADTHHWSGEVRRIYGFEEGVPVTMDMIFTGIHPEDQPHVERMVKGAANGQDFDIVFRVVTPSGEIRYANIVGHRMPEYPDRPVFVGAFQDITESRLADERLDRARRQLALVSRAAAVSALSASIAHEVSQPLVGILANASTGLRLLASPSQDIEGASASLQRILRDANRATEVIKRLRALFGRRAQAREPVDLNDAVREVLALCSGELDGVGARLTLQLDDDLPTLVGDRLQLQQVIANLILNAADAMREVTGQRSLVISTIRMESDTVRLEVQDSGVGASLDELTRFFDAFYTTKTTGMGVGLSISHSIIEAHGGIMTVQPNEGAGLTLGFTVPVSHPFEGDDLDMAPGA